MIRISINVLQSIDMFTDKCVISERKKCYDGTPYCVHTANLISVQPGVLSPVLLPAVQPARPCLPCSPCSCCSPCWQPSPWRSGSTASRPGRSRRSSAPPGAVSGSPQVVPEEELSPTSLSRWWSSLLLLPPLLRLPGRGGGRGDQPGRHRHPVQQHGQAPARSFVCACGQ